MEALRTALATLATIEARATDFVNAGEAISNASLQVLKASAAALETFHERITALEQAAGVNSDPPPAVQSDVAATVETLIPPPTPEPLPVAITPGPGSTETPAA